MGDTSDPWRCQGCLQEPGPNHAHQQHHQGWQESPKLVEAGPRATDPEGVSFASLTMYPPVSFTHTGPLCTSILQLLFLLLTLGSPPHGEHDTHGSRAGDSWRWGEGLATASYGCFLEVFSPSSLPKKGREAGEWGLCTSYNIILGNHRQFAIC